MLINTTIVTILCTIALHTTCMDHVEDLDYVVDLDLENPYARMPYKPCSIKLTDDIWKEIAYHFATQNLEYPNNIRSLRSTCKLLYEYLPKPTESSMRYRLWQQRKDEETIQKRNENIKTMFCMCYCFVYLPAVGGAAAATALITGQAANALIPIGIAASLHCIGACIGYECQDYWNKF